MNVKRAVRMSIIDPEAHDWAFTDPFRNSVNFASERTSKHTVHEKGAGEGFSSDLAPVRLCGMCVSDSQAYSPCSRSHLRKYNFPRRHPDRSEL